MRVFHLGVLWIKLTLMCCAMLLFFHPIEVDPFPILEDFVSVRPVSTIFLWKPISVSTGSGCCRSIARYNGGLTSFGTTALYVLIPSRDQSVETIQASSWPY